MDLYQKYLGLAKELKIPEENKFAWCEQRVKEEKDEQKAEREERKQKEDKDREERVRMREIEREIALAEQETKKVEITLLAEKAKTSQGSEGRRSDDFLMKMPRMPVFDERSDCLESFLHRFEIQAKAYGWHERQWSSAIINCLSGEPLKVFYTLAPEDANDYRKIKEALLKRFRLTEDGYLERFQTAKPEEKEDFNSYLNRTIQFFSRWLELANVKNGDYDGLYFLTLKNRVFQACNPDLVAFFKERKPTSTEELKKYAENYTSAHPLKPLSRVTNEPYYASSAKSVSHKHRHEFPKHDKVDSECRSRFQNRGQNENQTRSFNTWNKAKEQGKQSYGNNAKYNTVQNAEYSKYEKKNHTKVTCQFCSRLGHTAEACFKIVGYPVGYTRGKYSKGADTASASVDTTHSKQLIQSSENINVYCVKGMSLLTQTYRSGSLKLSKGKVNGTDCTTLRDTGCTTIGVRASMVKEEDKTGNKVQCITFSGNVETFDTANIYIESPYYTGRVECCLLQNPVADLIIGNIKGINDKEKNIEEINISEHIACTAETRSIAKQESPMTIPLEPHHYDHDDFVKAQREDKSIKTLFNLVNKSTEAKIKYSIENDILYRSTSKGNKRFKQIVAPTLYRDKILAIAHDSIASGHIGRSSTLKRISGPFTWPGITLDVRNYVKSCDVCQKRVEKGRVPKQLLVPTQPIENVFSRCSMGIVGSLPKSDRNHTPVFNNVHRKESKNWTVTKPQNQKGREKSARSSKLLQEVRTEFCRYCNALDKTSQRNPYQTKLTGQKNVKKASLN